MSTSSASVRGVLPDYFAGLDLGKQADPTALAILAREPAASSDGSVLLDAAGRDVRRFDVVHLERFPLGTPYPAVVDRVADLIRRPEIQPPAHPPHLLAIDAPSREPPVLVVDATGVGLPVADLLRARGLPCKLIPVWITAGTTPSLGKGVVNVPKSVLVSVAQSLFQTGRLRIVPTLPLAPLLREELQNFQEKITPAANLTFEARSGQHDDLVLAVAIAAWAGMNMPRGYKDWHAAGRQPRPDRPLW